MGFALLDVEEIDDRVDDRVDDEINDDINDDINDEIGACGSLAIAPDCCRCEWS
jgi:hypothetical protein